MSTIEDIKDVAGVVSDIFDNVSDIFGGQDTPKSPEEETEHPTLRESEEVWEGAKTELRIDNGKVYEIVFDEDGVPLRSIEVKLDPYPPLDEPEIEDYFYDSGVELDKLTEEELIDGLEDCSKELASLINECNKRKIQLFNWSGDKLEPRDVIFTNIEKILKG